MAFQYPLTGRDGCSFDAILAQRVEQGRFSTL